MKGLEKIISLVSRLVAAGKTVHLDSSALEKVSYKKGTLRVYFKNGGVYQYENVSEDTFENLLSAPSAGRYFVSEIKSSYTFQKVS